MKKIIILSVIILVLGIGGFAQAVPSLGVGTGSFDCTGATKYWECFSGNLGGESFALSASGETDGITLWTNITGYNIWLLAEPSIGSFTFNGNSSSLVSVDGNGALSDGAHSYQPPYQGINLGQVDSDWFSLPSSQDTPQGPFNPDEFWGLTGTLTYTGTDVVGDWLFLVADIGNNYPPFRITGRNHDKVSPKTTSAVGVPEPSTFLLLGSGLLGLAVYGRKRFKK